jgi:hypothetical protein
MKVAWSAQFVTERAALRLRHCCEDCAVFVADEQRCAHGWPNATHRRAYYDSGQAEIDFCKEFELI